MSTTTKDGGPAFPCFKGENYYSESGMSLRDWFAGQALNGILSISDPRTCPKETPFREWQAELAIEDARTCYAYADAMLKARENKA